MYECVKCSITSFLIGAMVGGIIVYSNKKLQRAIKNGTEMASEKFDELKNNTADKMEEAADKIDETAKKIRK